MPHIPQTPWMARASQEGNGMMGGHGDLGSPFFEGETASAYGASMMGASFTR